MHSNTITTGKPDLDSCKLMLYNSILTLFYYPLSEGGLRRVSTLFGMICRLFPNVIKLFGTVSISIENFTALFMFHIFRCPYPSQWIVWHLNLPLIDAERMDIYEQSSALICRVSEKFYFLLLIRLTTWITQLIIPTPSKESLGILLLPLSVRPSDRRVFCHLTSIYILSHSQIIL